MKIRNRNIVLVAAMAIAMLSFTTLPGGEFYRITVNGKQVIEQFLTKSQETPTLHINAFGSNDKLSVYYNHCGEMGTNRVITLKSSERIQKTWKFNAASGDQMTINLKELSAVAKGSESYQLVYSSNELAKSRVLANVRIGGATASN